MKSIIKTSRLFLLLPMILTSCGKEGVPEIAFDERYEFSTSEYSSCEGGGMRFIGEHAQNAQLSRFRIYVGATKAFERGYEEEKFPVDKHNYEFVLRMEARAKDEGEPFFVRDIALPGFPDADKYRCYELKGGEFPEFYPQTLIEDQFSWLKDDQTAEKQGGSISCHLAMLDKVSKKEVHEGFFEARYFSPIKFYYWHRLDGSGRVYYNLYPLFSVAPW